jgi:vacuolar-type H+-ATPase subunit C/Vma6
MWSKFKGFTLYRIRKDKTREGKTNLLAYIEHFDGFDSFKTLTEGLKVDYASFGNIDKFAIVSDKKWIKNIAEIESKILPGITMKGFDEGEKDKAMAWLQDK